MKKEAIVTCDIPKNEVIPNCRQNLGWWCGECPFAEFLAIREGLEIEIKEDRLNTE